jgi:hypothetical protein
MWYIERWKNNSDPDTIKLLCGKEWINARDDYKFTALTYAL